MIEQAREAVNALRMLEDCKKNHTACDDCPQYYFGGKIACHPIEYVYGRLADLIESLAAELEQVTQERDGLSIILTAAQSAAETYKRERDALEEDFARVAKGLDIEDLPYACEFCMRDVPGYVCGKCHFQWRGVKE